MFESFFLILGILILTAVAMKLLFPKQQQFAFATPTQVLGSDLGKAFQDVQERLRVHKKAGAFPIKFDIGNHAAWCSQTEMVEIISGLLEQSGWTVSKTADCGLNDIIIDVPRKKFVTN